MSERVLVKFSGTMQPGMMMMMISMMMISTIVMVMNVVVEWEKVDKVI